MLDIGELTRINKELNALYPEQVIYDGVINVAGYNAAKYKILWVLKEPNDVDSSSWSLLDFMGEKENLTAYPKWRKTYKLVIKGSYAILNELTEPDTLPNEESSTDVLRQIAYINISKVGGPPKSYYKDILEYYEKNRPLLLRQIHAIAPDIIINASRVDIGKDLGACDWQQVGKFCTSKISGGRLIDVYHPASRSITHHEYLATLLKCASLQN